jgi:hypothetical protein
MQKSMYLVYSEPTVVLSGCVNTLCGRLIQGQINGTGSRASMEPAIGIDANGLTGELLEIAWLVNGLEQRKKPCHTVSLRSEVHRDVHTGNTHLQ